jgi:hypothetical protein
MEFVVAVKDDIFFRLELSCKVGPKYLKNSCRCDDISSIATKIIRINNSVSTIAGDERNPSAQTRELGGIEWSGHRTRSNSFHEDWYAEEIHSFLHERFDGRYIGPGIILS